MTSQLTIARDSDKPRVSGIRRVKELDGVRGVAILMVIAFHMGRFGVDGSDALSVAYRSVAELGWAGVDLFFVLSGFLITGILLDTKHSGRYFRRFYIRRVLRILPLYYLCVFALFCVFLPLGPKLLPHWFHRQPWTQVGGGPGCLVLAAPLELAVGLRRSSNIADYTLLVLGH